LLVRENLSKYMANLVNPLGKPKNRQSFQNKILILSTDSITNLILKTLPIFRLLWIWYAVELRLLSLLIFL